MKIEKTKYIKKEMSQEMSGATITFEAQGKFIGWGPLHCKEDKPSL